MPPIFILELAAFLGGVALARASATGRPWLARRAASPARAFRTHAVR